MPGVPRSMEGNRHDQGSALAAPVHMNLEGGGTARTYVRDCDPKSKHQLEIITMHVRQQIVQQCQRPMPYAPQNRPFLQANLYI
jgi:hypothetical protein